MQFSTVLTALSFGIGAHAWAQSGSGEWIAHNDVSHGYGSPTNGAHQACTYRNTMTLVPIGGQCKFWTNGQGGIFWGTCKDNCGHTGCTRFCL